MEVKLEPLPESLCVSQKSHTTAIVKHKTDKKISKRSVIRVQSELVDDEHTVSASQVGEINSAKKLPLNTEQLQPKYLTDTEYDTENEQKNTTPMQEHHDQSEQSEHIDEDQTVPGSNEDSHDIAGETDPSNKLESPKQPPKDVKTDTETDQINANKRQSQLKCKRACIKSNFDETDVETAKVDAIDESRSTTTSNSDDTDRDTTSGNSKKRKFKCPQCKVVEYSLQHLNKSFRKDHDPVRCPTCGKPFNTPSGLHKHSYIHQNKPYKCDKCTRAFPFYSHLKSHQISHIDQMEYTCSAENCGKQFKCKNKYERHLAVHDEVEHHCNHPGCDYKIFDERNLVAHQKIHTPHYKRYVCLYCSKGFLHYTQWTLHYANECTKIPRAEKRKAQAKANL